MAKARTSASAMLRRLETARKQFEQTLQRAISAVQKEVKAGTRRVSKAATTRTRIAVQGPTGRPAPVQSAVEKVLRKRRRGLTMDGLKAALPNFDEKSLLNATFAMRRKGVITFEKTGKGRGTYKWRDASAAR